MYYIVKNEADKTKVRTDQTLADHQKSERWLWIAGALLSVFGAIFFLSKHLF